jgi:hypothetical protein
VVLTESEELKQHMQNPWKTAAAGAVLLGLVMSAQGAIVSDAPVGDDEWLQLHLVWTPTPGQAESYFLPPNVPPPPGSPLNTLWSVRFSLTGMSGQPDVILVYGQHIALPHPGIDVTPGEVYQAVLTVDLAPTSEAFNDAIKLHPSGGHFDYWKVNAVRLSGAQAGKIDVTLNATHIPEPQMYALFAGLGLFAFAAYRRSRRA